MAQQRLEDARLALAAIPAAAAASTPPSGSSLLVAAAASTVPSSVVTALQAVRASSLNCYLFEALPGDDSDTRASLITQQMQLADPCTFRIVVKVGGFPRGMPPFPF